MPASSDRHIILDPASLTRPNRGNRFHCLQSLYSHRNVCRLRPSARPAPPSRHGPDLWRTDAILQRRVRNLGIRLAKPAQSIMMVSSARVTAIGLALFTPYYQENFAVLDTIPAVLGYVDLVDGYVCWLEDVTIKGDCCLGLVRHDSEALMWDVQWSA
jgi:hypothetical protein